MICRYDPGSPCKSEEEWDSREAMMLPGNSLSRISNIRYIATATEEEQRGLAMAAFVNLATGWWEGIRSSHGGFVGDAFATAEEQRTVLGAFLAAAGDGRWELTPDFVKVYRDDIAGELRIGRGWCIHDPRDKHPYTLDDSSVRTAEELLREASFFWKVEEPIHTTTEKGEYSRNAC